MKRFRAHIVEISIAVATFIVVIVVALILVQREGAGPPLSYTEPEYAAERMVYAPGETLVYTASLTIARAGDIEEVERGFRTRPAAGRARLCDGAYAPLIETDPPPFPAEAVGTEVESRIEVPIPNLPPGDYWVISSAKKGDGGEALTEVAFSVLVSCDGS